MNTTPKLRSYLWCLSAGFHFCGILTSIALRNPSTGFLCLAFLAVSAVCAIRNYQRID